MRLKSAGLTATMLLGLGMALSGCARLEDGFASFTGRLSGISDRYGPSWGGMRPPMPSESLTVQRIRSGGAPESPGTLATEPGDVWPREEAPRATLANPDEALRGFRTGEEVPPPPRRRGSAAPAEPTVTAVPNMPAFDPPPPPPRANRTDTPRADGRVIPTPQGPVTTTGGTDRVQTTISPQGPGVAIRDGAVTTIIGPGGNVQQVPTPR